MPQDEGLLAASRGHTGSAKRDYAVANRRFVPPYPANGEAVGRAIHTVCAAFKPRQAYCPLYTEGKNSQRSRQISPFIGRSKQPVDNPLSCNVLVIKGSTLLPPNHCDLFWAEDRGIHDIHPTRVFSYSPVNPAAADSALAFYPPPPTSIQSRKTAGDILPALPFCT